MDYLRILGFKQGARVLQGGNTKVSVVHKQENKGAVQAGFKILQQPVFLNMADTSLNVLYGWKRAILNSGLKSSHTSE